MWNSRYYFHQPRANLECFVNIFYTCLLHDESTSFRLQILDTKLPGRVHLFKRKITWFEISESRELLDNFQHLLLAGSLSSFLHFDKNSNLSFLVEFHLLFRLLDFPCDKLWLTLYTLGCFQTYNYFLQKPESACQYKHDTPSLDRLCCIFIQLPLVSISIHFQQLGNFINIHDDGCIHKFD